MASIYKSISICDNVSIRVIVDDGSQSTRLLAQRSGTAVPITISVKQAEHLVRLLQSSIEANKENAGGFEEAYDFTA